MATRSKTPPALRPERGDESLLLRSAESLGRMIGTLQRQLDEATRHLTQSGEASPAPESPPSTARPKSKSKKAATSKSNGDSSGAAAKRTRHASSASAGGSARRNGGTAKPRTRKSATKKTRPR